MKTALVIVLCASSVVAQNKTAGARMAPACGAGNARFEVRKGDGQPPPAAPEPDKALVYMVAEEMDGCDTYCPALSKVGLDGSWKGANEGNSYFYFAVAPGEHHLCVTWDSKIALHKHRVALANFTAEAGKTYYFRTRVLETVEQGPHLDLDKINSDEGRFLAGSYPISSAHVK